MARIDGQLINAQVEQVASLPSGPQPLNRLVQSFGDIYTWNGTTWVRVLNSGNVSNIFLNLSPSAISYLSGSGTHRPSFWFNVLPANATAGATYTNNGVTFVVVRTIAGGGQLLLRATTAGTPFATGTLTKASGTGDATINFASYRAPLYSIVEMVGGGGAGGSGNNALAGGSGGSTTFGTATAGGGVGGTGAAAGPTGGNGGTITVGSFDTIFSLIGAKGSAGHFASPNYNMGGIGGGTPLGPGGTVMYNTVGIAPQANTGAGGGGGSINSAVNLSAGAGGGSGGYAKFFNHNPLTPQAYTVGAGGTFVVAGTNGFQGANGSSGIIIVTDYFQ